MTTIETETVNTATDPQRDMKVMWIDLESLEFLTDAEGNVSNLGGDVGDTTGIQSSLREDTTRTHTGLQQPIEITTQGPNGKYRVKDGHRRVTAIRQVVGDWNRQLALWKKKGRTNFGDEIDEYMDKVGVLRRIPAIVVGDYNDIESILDRQIVQFTTKQRDPITQARALAYLRKEHGWTLGKMSIKLGMALDKIESLMRMLDAPEVVQEKIRTGKMGTTTFERFFSGKSDEAQEEIVSQFEGDEVITGEKVRKQVRAKTEERQAQTGLPFMKDITVMPDLNMALSKIKAANGKAADWTNSTRIAAHSILLELQGEVNAALRFLGESPVEEAAEGEQNALGDE